MPIRSLNDDGREQWGRFSVAIAGSSHVGRVRRVNEDSFDRFDLADRDEILLVVADGLGGHRGGHVASSMAVGTLGKLCGEGDEDASTRLRMATERADAEIRRRASKDRTLKGMGTTIVALLLCPEGQSFVAHVGDSRLYRLRENQWAQLTEDHSVVALLVRDGAISPEEARDHPKRNQIMRALGVHDGVDVEINPIDLRPGDSYLLCSDGLYAMLPDTDLQALAEKAPHPEVAVAWMLDAANQAGGLDNITSMMIQIHDADV